MTGRICTGKGVSFFDGRFRVTLDPHGVKRKTEIVIQKGRIQACGVEYDPNRVLLKCDQWELIEAF